MFGACDNGESHDKYELLCAIKDPDHERHNDLLEWIGEDFDPESFNLSEVNEMLAGKR